MTSEELTRLFVDYGALTLTTSDGTLIGNTLECKERNRFCDVGFQDQSGHRLTEFIFDISLEDLEGLPWAEALLPAVICWTEIGK